MAVSFKTAVIVRALWYVLVAELALLALQAMVMLMPPPASSGRCALGPWYYKTIPLLRSHAGVLMMSVPHPIFLAHLIDLACANGSLKGDGSTAGRAALRVSLLLAVALLAVIFAMEGTAFVYILQVQVGAVVSCFSGVMKAAFYVSTVMAGLICGMIFLLLAGAAVLSDVETV